MISIIGAGPAGSTAAYYLAKNKIDVELIDKVKFPRDKPCAAALFNPLQFYKDFPFTKELNGSYVHKAKFYAGRHEAEFESKIPLVETFLRSRLDNELLKNALKAGAVFRLNKKPDSAVTINAAGVTEKKPYRRIGLCLVNDFKIKESIDTVHVHYCFDGIRGYAWLYPKKGYANIGIGAYLPQKNLRQVYSNYIDFLERRGIVTANSSLYKAKLIPLAAVKKPFTENSILVGDAAGFVRPSTGEGIYFAMCSGKIAAETIISKKPFSWYADECRRKFGKWIKPVPFAWSKLILSKAMQHIVKKASRDNEFRKQFAERFFRISQW